MRNDPYQSGKAFTPREYQVELLDQAREKNIIVCLGTGTGKTFIAVMLIKELANEVRKDLKEGGKRTFFLVNNVPLVNQQSAVIREHTDLSVGAYQGSLQVDLWDKMEWSKAIENHQVLVMTTQIFLDIINHGFWSLNRCNLLIFDECHHAIKRHPMREVLKHFEKYSADSVPKILGLTASMIQGKVRPAQLLDTINALERTMRCSAETTSDIANISRYGTDAKEFLVEFQDFNIDVYKSLILLLSEVNNFLIDFLHEKSEDEETNDESKLPKTFITAMISTFEAMGPWSSLYICKIFIEELEKIISNVPFSKLQLFLCLAKSRLKLFEHMLQQKVIDDGSYESLYRHATPKLLKLLEILKLAVVETNDETNSSNEFCSIIFVQRRHTACVLNAFLKEVAKRNPQEFENLKSCFITGRGMKEGLKESRMTYNSQEEVLNNFRQRHFNCMVATSVVEEGLDLPKCNLVIRFDRPLQYRSYIQSKGRARQQNSKYVLLINEVELGSFQKQLREFHDIEQILLKQSHGNPVPTKEEIAESFKDELYPPYKPEEGEGKPQITINSAISIVNRYCARLPSDTFTRLTTRLITKRIQTEENIVRYQCLLYLPINSPVKQLIVGEEADSAKLAKRIVALKTCEVLHKAGELDDNLLPLSKDALKLDEDEEDSEDEIVEDGMQAGTTKRRRNYVKQVADCLKNSFPICGEESYLYVITMKLVCPIPEEQNTRGRSLYDPATCSRCFAIVTKKPIPNICGFPVFTRSGEVSVKICKDANNHFFDSEQLKKLSYFHYFVFSDALRLEKAPMEFKIDAPESSYMIAPVQFEGESACCIDWNFVESIFNQQKNCYRDNRLMSKDFTFDKSLFEDAVVTPSYRNQDQPHLYYVAEILSNLSPLSEFPGLEYKTFQHYYYEKYKYKIHCLDQPLMDVDHTSARLNLLTPRYVNRKGVALPTSSEETKMAKRINLTNKQILVPELCHIHPFPTSLWKKAVCLPSIMYRINSLLLAEELRVLVSNGLNIGDPTVPQEWAPLDFGWNLADAFKDCENNEKKPEMHAKHECLVTNESTHQVQIKSNNASEAFKTETAVNHVDGEDDCHSNFPESRPLVVDDQSHLKLVVEAEGEILGEDITDSAPISEHPKRVSVVPDLKESAEDPEKFSSSGNKPKYTPESAQSNQFLHPKHPLSSKLFTLKSNKGDLSSNYCSFDNFSDIDPSELDDYEDEFELLNMKNLKIMSSGKESSFSDFLSCNGASNELENYLPPNEAAHTSKSDYETNNADHPLSKLPSGSSDSSVIIPSDVIHNRGDSPKPVEDIQKTDKFCKTITIKGRDQVISKNSLPISSILADDDREDSEPNIFQLLDDLDSDNPKSRKSQSDDLKITNSDVNGKDRVVFSEKNTSAVQFGDLIPNRDEKKVRMLDSVKSFSFDKQVDLKTHPGPSPSILLQALTMSNANDGINLERLETIGDSFLKYAVSVYLYCKHPIVHEGKLSYLRSRQVSNMNLYKLGKRKSLGHLMISAKFEPSDNWLPPCYTKPNKLIKPAELLNNHVPLRCENVLESVTNTPKNAECEKYTEIPFDLRTEHSIPDKSIADCVEALIGAYLITCGTKGALLFMSWLGFKVSLKPGIELTSEFENSWLELPPSPLLEEYVPNAHEEMSRLLSGHEGFEEVIGYQFKDKSYLLQAFTHASYHYNRLTDCYQRLEFLGDAILDYLITRHLYEDSLQHSPGALTDLRSALVNNTFFASLAVKYHFYKFFKAISPGLFQVIKSFVELKKTANENDMESFYLNEIDCDSTEAEEIEVPKALGDIFESVAGAIYLDSGMSLDTVWRVYYQMMKPEIEHFSSNVPKSPIRELLEMEPETAKFGKPERTIQGKIRVEVDVYGKGRFVGVGRNYRIAKCTAAKRALKYLKQRNSGRN